MSASVSDSDSTPTRQAFDRRVEEVKTCKSDINFVVLDYLISEGFPEAAEKFAAEANVHRASSDSENIYERVEIRNAILSGNIQAAIEQINELLPELLEQNTALHFSLLRLQLLELIKTSTAAPDGDITPALEFASSQVAPIAPTNPTFLSELEKTMALLIFPPDRLTPQLQALLDPEMRVKVAEKVNEAILEALGHIGLSRLRRLARLRVWAEKKARERGIEMSASALDLWGHTTESDTSNGDISNGTGDVTMAV